MAVAEAIAFTPGAVDDDGTDSDASLTPHRHRRLTSDKLRAEMFESGACARASACVRAHVRARMCACACARAHRRAQAPCKPALTRLLAGLMCDDGSEAGGVGGAQLSNAESAAASADALFNTGKVAPGTNTMGYRFDSPEWEAEVKQQRKATWEWLKGVGSKVFEGVNLTRISLPVRLFEGRSYLERIRDNWSYLHLLERAVAERDPVRRCVRAADSRARVRARRASLPRSLAARAAQRRARGAGGRALLTRHAHAHATPRGRTLSQDDPDGCLRRQRALQAGELRQTL